MNKIIKNKSLFFCFSTIVVFFYLALLIHLTKQVLTSQESKKILGRSTTSSVTEVSLSIGEFRFTLFGYTSPHALVTFSGLGIFDQTYANNEGYFIFKNRFSPFSPREACLTAQDQLGRLSSPLCLPAFPTSYNVEIGPVIMPPTLSLDKNNYYIGDKVILSGQTIPNTEVNLSMFVNQTKAVNLAQNQIKNPLAIIIPHFFPQPVMASSQKPETQSGFAFPRLTLPVDEKGNFTVTLPSSSAKTFRLFAQVDYQKNPSPESRKLTLKILPWWMIIIQFFLIALAIIKSRLLEMIILLQLIGLVIYFLRRYFHPKTLAIARRQNMAIILRQPKLEINLKKQPN